MFTSDENRLRFYAFLLATFVHATKKELSHRHSVEKNLHVSVNPLTPKISGVILLTVCQTIIITLVRRIWYQIN